MAGLASAPGASRGVVWTSIDGTAWARLPDQAVFAAGSRGTTTAMGGMARAAAGREVVVVGATADGTAVAWVGLQQPGR